MLKHSSYKACFEHSDLLMVIRRDHQPRKTAPLQHGKACNPNAQWRTPGTSPNQSSTTDVLTATTLIYAIGAGITAAAGTRLALQLVLVKRFKLYSFQLQNLKGSALLFIVTTSPNRDWVICAPAAFLGCGSRFSGSLSGIEPLFPVTRDSHGKPLPYHQKPDRAENRMNRRRHKAMRSA